MFLDPIFDLLMPKQKETDVYAIITYEDGTTEKQKIEMPKGYSVNMSMGALSRMYNQRYVEDLDKRMMELLNKRVEEK